MDSFTTENAIEQRLFDKAQQNRTPISATLELTPLCNMNCDMCYVRLSAEEMRHKGRMLTGREWLSLAQSMHQQGLLFVMLTGGEPLLHPDFKEIYLGLRQMGMILTLNTNGTLIDESWADFFAAHPPRRINITLYGAGADVYESLCHHRAGFEQTLHGIRLLKERRLSVKMNVSLTRKNLADIEEILAIAHELDVPAIIDTYMSPASREREKGFDWDSRVSPEDAARIRVRALQEHYSEQEYLQEAGKMLYISRHALPDEGRKGVTCKAGRCSLMINWQGQMRPCVVMSGPAFDVQKEGFLSCWQQLVKAMDQIWLNEKCSACPDRVACRNCAACALQEAGSYDGVPEYMCRYARCTLQLLEEDLKQKGIQI